MKLREGRRNTLFPRDQGPPLFRKYQSDMFAHILPSAGTVTPLTILPGPASKTIEVSICHYKGKKKRKQTNRQRTNKMVKCKEDR